MFLLVDNYDSFTYNLWHFLEQLGVSVAVKRNDKVSVQQALNTKPRGIIISPGPCDPAKAGISLDLIKSAPLDLPILGVCLGHQCIGQAFGAKVIRSSTPMHGKLSTIEHYGDNIFKNIPQKFTATRYHSLIVEKSTLPKCIVVTAETEDGLIMGLAHKKRPVYGVQFHPESIASEYGYTLLSNFLELAGVAAISNKVIDNLQQNLIRTK